MLACGYVVRAPLPLRFPSILIPHLSQRTSALTLSFANTAFSGMLRMSLWHWDYKLACRAHLLAFVVRRDTPPRLQLVFVPPPMHRALHANHFYQEGLRGIPLTHGTANVRQIRVQTW